MTPLQLPANALGALEAVLVTRDTVADVVEWCSGVLHRQKLTVDVAGTPISVPFGCFVVRFDAGFGVATASWVDATLNGASTALFNPPVLT